MPFVQKEINKKLVDELLKLKVARSSARVYASQILSIVRAVKVKVEDFKLQDLTQKKFLNHVSEINNLTKRKNAASAIVAGLKVIGEKKIIDAYRQVLMKADKDYTAFLASGKRKRPFTNADKTWGKIRTLWKKLSSIVGSQKIWQRGEAITVRQYRTLMAFVYLKFLSDMPVRRLEYSDTRFIDASAAASAEKGNYIVVYPKKMVWRIEKYKTYRTFGRQDFPVSVGLRKLLLQIRPLSKAKNNDEYIFLNTRWRKMSRDIFSRFVSSVFNTYMGRHWTQNTIRSIKVSSVWKDSIKTIDALKISEEMGHDPRTAMLHYRQES